MVKLRSFGIDTANKDTETQAASELLWAACGFPTCGPALILLPHPRVGCLHMDFSASSVLLCT